MRLSLAAGTVLDLAPADVIECAAGAGYPLAGVRLTDPAAQAAGVAAALSRTGIGLLDVEVVRLGPGPLTTAQRRLAETAGRLGARFLLTVSEDPDTGAAAAKLGALGELLAGSGTRVTLEPMAFTAVRSRADAEGLARAAPGTTVLLDPLHLHRMGDPLDTPADPTLVRYAQLTDVARPACTPVDLAREARGHRVPPGHGGLALAGFVAALPPGVPLAVEVQSDSLRATTGPRERAELLRAAALAVPGVAGRR